MQLNKTEIQCVNEIVDIIVNSEPIPNNGWNAETGNLTKLIDMTIKRLFSKEEDRKSVTKKMYMLLVYPYEKENNK